MRVLVALALGTFISEDGTSIGAGLLAGNGELPLASAVAACAIGVYVGDLLLWLAGRILGRRLLGFRWISRVIDPASLDAFGPTLDAHLCVAVLASRFLPGTRLPMYVAAGIWGRRPIAFAGWSLLAVLLWTPLLVLLTATYGAPLTSPLLGQLGEVSQLVVTGALLLAGLKMATRMLSRVTRAADFDRRIRAGASTGTREWSRSPYRAR
jgi:membrane protein DedA with SNARE-associated domain